MQHKYDQVGNLRYTQDPNQAAAGQVYFTTYDFANRPLVSGLGAADFGSLNAFTSASFEGTEANWLVVRQCDVPPPAAFPWTLFPTPLLLTNVSGRLAAVASKSNGAWQATFFSYDADGRVAKRYTYTQANGGGSVLTALNTTSTYVRDLRGALTARADTIGSATFHHWYQYDTRGLLWKVFAATTAAKPASPDVTYTYRPSGQVESRQFAGEVQPVPFRYTIREQLEKIGDPAATTYPFSARYSYHPNGTVWEAEFYNAGSPAAEKRYGYVFGLTSYDALNRLKSADFSYYNGGWVSSLAHDLANITYDAAGNLRGLQRRNDAGALVDDLTYYYDQPGTNRLTSITDAISGNAEIWDARSGSFTYDANGNLKSAPAPYSIAATAPIVYDHQNLALSITRAGTTTTYRYNESGQRITKQVGTGNIEVYLLDGATSLGVVTVDGAGSPTAWFFNVVAGDKVVGRQPNTGNRRYYHTDLLGSTRAVVEGTTVVESYDFEPWGLLMPGRTLAGPTKEGFTSKEQDAETGLDYFGARYYMAALARWTAVDPLAEKHPEWAPYHYVLDNPLALFDPDGRQSRASFGDLLRPGSTIPDNAVPPAAGEKAGPNWAQRAVRWALETMAEGMEFLHSLVPRGPMSTTAVSGVDPTNPGHELSLGERIGAQADATLNWLPIGAGSGGTVVIGKLDELRHLRRGERALTNLPNRGSPAANWRQNAGELRRVMREGKPIRDAHVDPKTGKLLEDTRANGSASFLSAERNLLRDRGWTYDPSTQHWNPPPN